MIGPAESHGNRIRNEFAGDDDGITDDFRLGGLEFLVLTAEGKTGERARVDPSLTRQALPLLFLSSPILEKSGRRRHGQIQERLYCRRT